MSQRKRGSKGLGFWALLALVAHLELGLGLGVMAYFYAPRRVDLVDKGTGESDTVELGVLDDETARKILAEYEREEEKRKQEEAKKEEESSKAPGQVVELAKPTNEERPDDARFVSEYDSKVDKQTRKFGELDEKARQGRSDGKDPMTTPATPAAQPRQPSKGNDAASKNPTKALAMRSPAPAPDRQPQVPGQGPESLSGPSPETEAGPPDGDGRDLAVGSPAMAPPGGGQPMPDVSGAPGLMPTPQQLARAIGSGTSDHLDGIDEGDETALNAKKWKFASFFNRVKKQVRDHWKPADEYRKRDPTFRIYGQKDRFTLLHVQLKADGTLANVALETPSGVDFLDDEAIEAFKDAQPFPNPPRQLVEDGVISFRFGFYFEIGSDSPKMKWFRYDDL